MCYMRWKKKKISSTNIWSNELSADIRSEQLTRCRWVSRPKRPQVESERHKAGQVETTQKCRPNNIKRILGVGKMLPSENTSSVPHLLFKLARLNRRENMSGTHKPNHKRSLMYIMVWHTVENYFSLTPNAWKCVTVVRMVAKRSVIVIQQFVKC